MAKKSKPNKTPQRGTKKTGAAPRQLPKERVFEEGLGEQGNEQIVQQPTARSKERDEYRHGGIPLGADPRE